MIKSIKTLKVHIESIITIKCILDTLIQKVFIITDRVQKEGVSQQDLLLLRTLFVEIEAYLLLCKKKRYIIQYKLKKIIQITSYTTKLNKLHKRLTSIFNIIEELTKYKNFVHILYLKTPKEQKKITLLIIKIQNSLEELYKVCLLIQNILTLSIHNTYRQQDISYSQYTNTKESKCYTINYSVKLEDGKGLIITKSV